MKKHRTLLAALLIWITALSLLSPAFADSTSPRQPIRPPHIGTDGRLVLPAPQIFPRLPTEVHTFFPNHHAYHYDARLYQEGIGKIGSTEGYTLSGDRAYNEIESILGRTPRWGEWAKDIQKQKAQKGGIQILGQLSKTGPQTTGDYNGYAEFDTYGKNTRFNVQYEVFDKLLPLINNYNHLAERLEQTDYLTPQEKARHLDTHLQTQQHPILPSNPQYLKDLTRGITRTRQVREIIGAANQPLSHPLTPEQLTQIGQNAPYLDPSLSYLAHHTQRAEANFAANQQDSWQRWNGESPTPPNLSPYGQQLNRSSGALDHLIGDRSTYLIQRSGLDEAAARAYRNLVPTDIQATVSQSQAAAARFGEDNPDFAAAFGYGTRVAGVAGGVKGIEKALRALPRHPRADGLPRTDSPPPSGRFFRESKLPPVSHDFAEAAEAMFRSRHPEVAPAQNKAAAGNANKGRMHTGGRERQPESGKRQPEYAKAERAGRPDTSKSGKPNPRPEKPSYKHGESDGGPGEWGRNHTPAKGADYQHQVTGAPRHTEYIVKTDLMPSGKKAFDGYDPKRDVLLDAKDWDDWPIDKKFAIDSVIRDARQSSDVAQQVGKKLEWHVPTEAKKQQLEEIFRDRGGINIDIVVTPKIK